MVALFVRLSLCCLALSVASGFTLRPQVSQHASASFSSTSLKAETMDRREMFQASLAAAASLVAVSAPQYAIASTGADAGKLPDLPPEAVRSYLQYRVSLQTAADYYLWELQDKMGDTDEWGEVAQLFRVNNNKGQGQPSRIEREFVNPMRIIGLSMDPDVSEDMRDAQFQFEKAMATMSKATQGVRRDMPVEVDKSLVVTAQKGWEDGRLALNKFFAVLNDAVGMDELKPIPPPGPNQTKEYGRSQRKFLDLEKKIKLCQNRGGPTLSQTWGQLMVSGYLQDSCGIPDMDSYFYQGSK